jgi:uncharacterized membrane protein
MPTGYLHYSLSRCTSFRRHFSPSFMAPFFLYRPRGISIFAALCLGFRTLAESVSFRTGFPFRHYYFTDVMGPKIFQLPVLLALA